MIRPTWISNDARGERQRTEVVICPQRKLFQLLGANCIGGSAFSRAEQSLFAANRDRLRKRGGQNDFDDERSAGREMNFARDAWKSVGIGG